VIWWCYGWNFTDDSIEVVFVHLKRSYVVRGEVSEEGVTVVRLGSDA